LGHYCNKVSDSRLESRYVSGHSCDPVFEITEGPPLAMSVPNELDGLVDRSWRFSGGPPKHRKAVLPFHAPLGELLTSLDLLKQSLLVAPPKSIKRRPDSITVLPCSDGAADQLLGCY